MTSRWLLQVQQVREIAVKFHVMSLSVLNEGRKDLPERYVEMLAEGWGPVRVVIAAEQKFGNEVVSDLYTALGTRIHLHDTPLGRDLYVAALEEVGLPVELAEGATTVSINVRLDHLQPSPVGADVVAEAVLAKVDGRRLTFTVSANDERGLVAVGKVVRVIVDVDRFLSRCGCNA